MTQKHRRSSPPPPQTPRLLVGPIVIEAPQRARRRPSPRPEPRTIDVQWIDAEAAPDRASDRATIGSTIDWLDVTLKVLLFVLGGWLYLFIAHGKPMRRNAGDD